MNSIAYWLVIILYFIIYFYTEISGSKLTKCMIFFRMLRNVVRANVITRRNIILNRAFLARGSNTKKEKQEKSPKNDESTSSNQQTSSKTRFGWNDLYMRSHYDSDTKSKGEETKLRL